MGPSCVHLTQPQDRESDLQANSLGACHYQASPLLHRFTSFVLAAGPCHQQTEWEAAATKQTRQWDDRAVLSVTLS